MTVAWGNDRRIGDAAGAVALWDKIFFADVVRRGIGSSVMSITGTVGAGDIVLDETIVDVPEGVGSVASCILRFRFLKSCDTGGLVVAPVRLPALSVNTLISVWAELCLPFSWVSAIRTSSSFLCEPGMVPMLSMTISNSWAVSLLMYNSVQFSNRVC